jgi:hypothetical protein
MSDPENACASLDSYPIVALARGLRVLREVGPCIGLRNPHPNDQILCARFATQRFKQLEYLQGGNGSRRAKFLTLNEYEHGEPGRESGVNLLDGRSYLIFARPASNSIPLEADWDVTAACPIS